MPLLEHVCDLVREQTRPRSGVRSIPTAEVDIPAVGDTDGIERIGDASPVRPVVDADIVQSTTEPPLQELSFAVW